MEQGICSGWVPGDPRVRAQRSVLSRRGEPGGRL